MINYSEHYFPWLNNWYFARAIVAAVEVVIVAELVIAVELVTAVELAIVVADSIAVGVGSAAIAEGLNADGNVVAVADRLDSGRNGKCGGRSHSKHQRIQPTSAFVVGLADSAGGQRRC